MKVLIPIVIGLLMVGCGKKEEITNNDDKTNTPEKPPKELTLEEKKVVGEYELKYENGHTSKWVFLENGIAEPYSNGKKNKSGHHSHECKWMIVDGELHIIYESGSRAVFRINPDGSITCIKHLGGNGERVDIQKDKQLPFKKIK